jgi:class 3 adenylate cyclase
MKQLYFFLILLFSIHSFAQSNVEVDQLNQNAESQLNNHPTESIKLAEKAKSLAKSSGNKKGLTKATSILGVAYYKIDNYTKSEQLINEAYEIAAEEKDSSSLAFCKYWLGNLQLNSGEYSKALDLYQVGLDIATKVGDKKNIARCLDGKATIYESLNESDKAREFYNQSLEAANSVGFREWTAGVMASLGNLALRAENYEDALKKFNESIVISEEVNNMNNKANCLQQIATIYYYQNNSKAAIKNVQEAMNIFESTGSMSSFSYSRLLMSSILLKDREYDLAIGLAGMSYDEGDRNKETQLQKNAAEILYACYAAKGDKGRALEWHVRFHKLAERNQNEELTKRLTQMELQANFEKERELEKERQAKKDAIVQAEIQKQRLITYGLVAGALLLLVIAIVSIYAFIQKKRDNKIIAEEKRKVDELLLNILPEDIARELQLNGKTVPRNYDLVTVLFADIKNFTLAAEHMSPDLLVSEIDLCFQAFDEIVTKYKIEKIKTIGDAYLCAGGLPKPFDSNPGEVVKAALEMQKFMRETKANRQRMGGDFFEVRIGIHTGPLVAGIVGMKKFAYDIWGDTVNIAARFEQNGEVGQINISSATYELIKDKFKCTYHGKVELKNKGMLDMYFVDSEL